MSTQSNEQTAAQLNQYLKGIYMGINAFQTFVDKAEHTELKRLCDDVLANFERYAKQFSDQIKSFNEDPTNDDALLTKVGQWFEDLKYLTIKNDQDVLKEVIKGLEMGIDNSDKFLKEHDVNNDETYQLIKDIVHDNKAFFNRAKALTLN